MKIHNVWKPLLMVMLKLLDVCFVCRWFKSGSEIRGDVEAETVSVSSFNIHWSGEAQPIITPTLENTHHLIPKQHLICYKSFIHRPHVVLMLRRWTWWLIWMFLRTGRPICTVLVVLDDLVCKIIKQLSTNIHSHRSEYTPHIFVYVTSFHVTTLKKWHFSTM